MRSMRRAIENDSFLQFRKEFHEKRQGDE